ncbi:SusD/RagB family nutrient-binding outer membrane lipoprotein [Siphonobacter curvatus]|uniref:SusD/RagB family nutrient-binding outer membrane lipoprotein n=1 Tax=Siphonobacter curvatus TaxID=2094562 RepID=A0A2S7IM62_9BACT|nr:SusD/RagB family nutrient-binding outer membrane lipoprotein [Siphonobacter curvatus]PQA58775.1 SusD/RagB family nutrient-binding outer membrane lipoprotein [Siphonobacter curvatus]
MIRIFHSFRYKAALAFVLVGLSACTGEFDQMNTNPNNPTTASAELFMPHGIQTAVDAYWGGSLGMDVGNLVPQHWARIQYTDVDQYTTSNDVANAGWSNFYIEALADYQRIYKISQETGNTNYQAVATILRSWVFTLLTDVYGDIPYSDAIKGMEGTLQPKYDAQKDVYAGLIAELKTAAELINTTDKSKAIAGDILFNGDLTKWKKFANSQSLRILNRMLAKADAPIDVKAEIERILKDPTKYPVLTSNADNVQLVYLNAAPSNNPVNENRKTRDDHRVSATLVNKLKGMEDARLKVYANLPADGGDYKGVPNGLSASDANALGLSKTSKVGDYFVSATAPGVIMTYAELLFIKAEFAYKGITWAGEAATLYTDAIKASHAQYGLTASDAYLTANAFKSGTAGYTQLIEQKWIALYGQGVEAWTEYRRTGIPVLTPPTLNTNGGVIPTRLPYPGSEESLNYTNFSEALKRQGGQNDKKLKLWFAK